MKKMSVSRTVILVIIAVVWRLLMPDKMSFPGAIMVICNVATTVCLLRAEAILPLSKYRKTRNDIPTAPLGEPLPHTRQSLAQYAAYTYQAVKASDFSETAAKKYLGPWKELRDSFTALMVFDALILAAFSANRLINDATMEGLMFSVMGAIIVNIYTFDLVYKPFLPLRKQEHKRLKALGKLAPTLDAAEFLGQHGEMFIFAIAMGAFMVVESNGYTFSAGSADSTRLAISSVITFKSFTLSVLANEIEKLFSTEETLFREDYGLLVPCPKCGGRGRSESERGEKAKICKRCQGLGLSFPKKSKSNKAKHEDKMDSLLENIRAEMAEELEDEMHGETDGAELEPTKGIVLELPRKVEIVAGSIALEPESEDTYEMIEVLDGTLGEIVDDVTIKVLVKAGDKKFEVPDGYDLVCVPVVRHHEDGQVEPERYTLICLPRMKPCNKCHGTGLVKHRYCQACKGSGYVSAKKKAKK